MNKKLISAAAMATLLVLPIAGFAALLDPAEPVPSTTINVIGLVNKVLSFLWPLFFGGAVIALLLAGFMFLTARGDEDALKTARDAVVWSMVGIALGVLAYTIPYVVRNVLGL